MLIDSRWSLLVLYLFQQQQQKEDKIKDYFLPYFTTILQVKLL